MDGHVLQHILCTDLPAVIILLSIKCSLHLIPQFSFLTAISERKRTLVSCICRRDLAVTREALRANQELFRLVFRVEHIHIILQSMDFTRFGFLT